MSDNIENLRTALSAAPNNWEVRYSLIHSLHQAGETNDAIELLNEISELPTDDKEIIYAAQCYHVLGATDQAEQVYRSALQINPNNQLAIAGLESLGIAVEPPTAIPVAHAVVPINDDDDHEATPPVAVAALADDEPPVAVAIPTPDRTVGVSDNNNQPEQNLPTNHTVAAAAPTISQEDTTVYDPEVAELMDQIAAAGEESKRQHRAAIAKDRINSIIVTILVHIAVIFLLSIVITKKPKSVPPQIVASSSAETPDDTTIEKQVMEKNALKANPNQTSAANILSVDSIGAISLTSELDTLSGMETPTETGMTFQPSMSMGMPSDSQSMMMFGQPLEGETLGVVLDVSGSMAEWLPLVIAEVDRNFKDAPIVYVTNARIEKTNREVEIRPIVEEEVRPTREDGTRSPFWFLWGDLPRKAPQRSVDRLIDTFKTRPNQFIALGDKGHWHGGDRIGNAMRFLGKEGCDAVYVFSDFEDFIDEEKAQEHGQHLARTKVRAYIQPAVNESEFISIMSRRVASRSKGRQLPSLHSVINPEDDTPKPLVPKPSSNDPETMVAGVKYATPREDVVGKEFYDFRPGGNWTELARLEEPEFDAVFYGPEARGAIFLKDREGKYIQAPITFGYHSHKYLPEHPDRTYRWRRRKFLRNAEPPKFDGKEIVWKMILEDNLKFDVHLYIDRKGMNATYVADPPEDETSDNAYIYFRVPNLAKERNDRYFGQDLPKDGLKLNDVRLYAKRNEVTFNLPRSEKDRYEKEWMKRGFESGYNTRTFDTLITHYPHGIRDMKIQGASFGPRIFHARTTSSKILLHAGAGRSDSEPWEGFHARLTRSNDRRTRFSKTEAIALMIE